MRRALIYHICRQDEWIKAQAAGIYNGSSQDINDGFIHFSTAKLIIESAAKHRFGQDNLALIEVNSEDLGDKLKWEVSRNNIEFPHLYDALKINLVIRDYNLKLGSDGTHVFPRHWNLGQRLGDKSS